MSFCIILLYTIMYFVVFFFSILTLCLFFEQMYLAPFPPYNNAIWLRTSDYIVSKDDLKLSKQNILVYEAQEQFVFMQTAVSRSREWKQNPDQTGCVITYYTVDCITCIYMCDVHKWPWSKETMVKRGDFTRRMNKGKHQKPLRSTANISLT